LEQSTRSKRQRAYERVFPASRLTLQSWWKSLKYRDRTEIIGLILQAVEGEPLTSSRITYQAMLNFKQTNEYTAFLIQEGLLRYLMLDRKYSITDKGRQFLTLFNETDTLLTTSNDDNMTDDNLQVQNQQQQQEVAIHK
jgi:predicted transcriptional regulator